MILRAVFGLAVLGLSAMPSVADDAPTTPRMVRQAIERVIQPGYAAFSSTSRRLEETMGELCAAPSAANLELARQSFGATAEAWAGIETIRFGPVTEENRLERILYWPDRRGIGLKQVQEILATKDASAANVGTLVQKSVAVQGLGAEEFVLFGTGYEELSSVAGAFRCGYGKAVAANLHLRGEDIFQGWLKTDGVAGQWENPGPANPSYRSDGEALGELVDTLIQGIEMIRDVRIDGFLGETADKDKPKLALFWRSDKTVASLRKNLASLRQLFEQAGFHERLPAEQRWLAESIAFEFRNAENALFAIEDEPIDAVLADPKKRGKLAYARVVTTGLSSTIGEQLTTQFGLTAGFSSLDGD